MRCYPLTEKTTAKIGLCFLVVGGLCLLYVWAELAYRRVLYSSYGSKPYLNHVDDSYFTWLPSVAYFGGVCAAVAAIAAGFLHYRLLTVACVILAASGWAATRLLDYYHRTLVLVPYSEFAANCGV